MDYLLKAEKDIEQIVRMMFMDMKAISSVRWVLFAFPLVVIFIFAWVLGCIPSKSAIGKVLSSIAEEDLDKLLKKNGFPRTPLAVFQAARIIVSVFLGLAIQFILGVTGAAKWIALGLAAIGTYKFFYFYLVYKDRARIKRLNTVLPYTIKSIAYLASVYPVNNALIKAIEIAPKDFKTDLEILCADIDDDPVTFSPYQKFIDRYDGRLNRLDYYFKTLYRMSKSAGKEEVKLLSNLNETISEEMSSARKLKNDAINNRVTYLGLIPVALLTLMLLFLMVVISTSI